MEAPKLTINRARELRRKLTLPEVILWTAVRGRRVARAGFGDNILSDPTFWTSIAMKPGWRLRSTAMDTCIPIRERMICVGPSGWRREG
jgi:hypothetical protein